MKTFIFSDCDGVSVPAVDNYNKTQELCPRCECKYESRNTGVIKVRNLTFAMTFAT